MSVQLLFLFLLWVYDDFFYHENGYIVVDDVYSMDEVNAMRAVVEELVEKSREVSDHNDIYDLEPAHSPENPRVRRIKEPFKVHPLYREMVEHPNIISIMKKLIGVNQRLHGGKINIKAASFGSPVEWHQDWAFYPHTNDDVLAIGVMLDDMTEENGPLLIMPGSHKGPTYDHHADGSFAGAINPNDCPLDFSKAARVTGSPHTCTRKPSSSLVASAMCSFPNLFTIRFESVSYTHLTLPTILLV